MSMGGLHEGGGTAVMAELRRHALGSASPINATSACAFPTTCEGSLHLWECVREGGWLSRPPFLQGKGDEDDDEVGSKVIANCLFYLFIVY